MMGLLRQCLGELAKANLRLRIQNTQPFTLKIRLPKFLRSPRLGKFDAAGSLRTNGQRMQEVMIASPHHALFTL